MDAPKLAAQSFDVSGKVAQLLEKRLQLAQKHYRGRLDNAAASLTGAVKQDPAAAVTAWSQWYDYATDAAQRTVLFWDALRQRGNNFVEHTRAGLPPVLHFDYETIVDGRKLPRPVNYALVRIVPPEGVTVDPKRRPYLIIDPRAGHGPGIGGFKDDSQVGVALRAGHPVYFVIFFRDPEPGQTLLDVCEAEKAFVREVRARHAQSPKPAIVGNCQGGWAAMMLAAADPDDTGPIVINGAPMSYWGGAWQEGDNDNPMRYSGGILGGTWLASLTSDLGNGIFDGAYLVENFENLNPANTFWDKYYHLYANVDTEPPRFLEFERWWGGFYLMNREEIEWITRNLFVGNKVWKGGAQMRGGKPFDLTDIKAPIVLFASMGDNITPPQQAFNWVADVYGSTEEIKARGQVIVGLLHQSVGHLGIFVSGSVAKKEHAQIVSVLKSIEGLPPGLYGMAIKEKKGKDGEPEYEVEFRERRLEDISAQLNKFRRADERPFEAVAAISEFNQRAYELFAQPFVQSLGNEFTAKVARQFHPLRFQRWAFSDLNPWLAWLKPAAEAVKAARKPARADSLPKRVEAAASEAISASLDYYRALRDAQSEAAFFQIYGNVFALYLADKHQAEAALAVADARELPFVQSALAAIEEGGYPEAVARVAYLLLRKGEPMMLSWLERKEAFVAENSDLMPAVTREAWRRIRGEQEIIARYAPDKAIATLPKLLADARDRERLRALLERLAQEAQRMRREPTAEQVAMFTELGRTIEAKPSRARKAAAARKAPAARKAKRRAAA
ncbi:MAG: DUF3141 domain-containing protein [Burkholderiales bacterium]